MELQALPGLYSDPVRDPRGHTVTAVYMARAHGEPEVRDDARALWAFLPEEFPKELAFDHATVLADYLHYRNSGNPAPLRLG